MRRPHFRSLTPRQIVFDVALAVLYVPVFGLGIVDVMFGIVSPEAARYLGLIAVVILAGALAVRRLSPGLALALAWAGAIVQMALGFGPQPFDVAIFCVVYVTAAYGTRGVRRLGLASAVFGAVVATAYMMLALWISSGGALDLWANTLSWFLLCGFALLLSWTVGALVRSSLTARENKRAQERAEFEAAGEQERGRIARDMHDVVAHSLAVVVAQADGARYAAEADPQAAKEALATISQTARAALTDVRLLLAQLRHRQGEGPQPTLADLEGLFAQVRGAGVDLAVEIDPVAPGEPPAAVQIAVYRILQEALTNALRHGAGRAVDVRMAWRQDGLGLVVMNAAAPDGRGGQATHTGRIGVGRPEADGGFGGDRAHGDDAAIERGGADDRPVRRGPDAQGERDRQGSASRGPGGHGIVGMTERAQLVGGSLTAARDGRMFVVRAHLPVSGYARGAAATAAGTGPTEGAQ